MGDRRRSATSSQSHSGLHTITTNSDDLIGAKRAPLAHAGAMSSPSPRRFRSRETVQLAPSPLCIAQEVQNMRQNDFGIVKGRKMIEAGKRNESTFGQSCCRFLRFWEHSVHLSCVKQAWN